MLTGAVSCSNAQQNKEVMATNEKTIVVDVRTTDEWKNDGHADCSVNYPLDQFSSKINSLKTYEKVVLVCRSGNRASHAESLLRSAGFKNIENKGSWKNINCK